MSRMKLMKKLRAEPWFPQITAELKRLGVEYEFRPPTGKGHPKLVIMKNGREAKLAVPNTGGGGTNYAYLISELRSVCGEPPR